MGGLSRLVGLTGGVVLNHSFLITLLDTSSGDGALALSILKSIAFDLLLGGFSECTGLEMSLQIEQYKEGGNNARTLIFPSRTEWSQITLKKGVGAGQGLWDWSYGFVEGKGKRQDGLIILLNDMKVPNNIWYFRRGLPVKFSAPPLNAKESAVAIESMVIAHEGVYQVPYVGWAATAVTGITGLAI